MPLDPFQIEALRPWIEGETGMDFSGSRVGRLRDALEKVLPAGGAPLDLEQLRTLPQERAVFLERLTAELTVGESFFFRNEHHFRALREQTLPEILRANADRREIRIWSAGCAGGEEPYSLAILLDQMLGANHDWRVSILGTDLNPAFLERARQGRYRSWSFRHTRIHEDRAYFVRDARDPELLQLDSRIRGNVRFAYLNLVKDVYPSPLTGTLGLDLIVFRNVAIYLKEAVTRRIIERFHQALRPGGWLLLGETEVSLIATEGFEPRRFPQATFHQKTVDFLPVQATPQPPALADFVWPQSSPAPVSVPIPPTLPDWAPLPERLPAGRVAEPSDVGDVPVEKLLAENRLPEAERLMDRLPDRRQRARSRLRLTQELLRTGEVARARRMLELCLTEEPLLIEAQLLRGSFAEEAGDLPQAEQAYRRALYLDRLCPMAHFHLALVQQRQGDQAGARRSVQATLKLIENRDAHELVEHGEGVCHGRLREMARMILGE